MKSLSLSETYLISRRSSLRSLIAACSTSMSFIWSENESESQMKIYWWWRTMPSRKKTKGVGGGKQWQRTSWFSSCSRSRGAKSTQVEEYSTKSCCYLFFCSPFAPPCSRCGRKELLKIVELWHDVRLPRKKKQKTEKLFLRIWSCSSIKEFRILSHARLLRFPHICAASSHSVSICRWARATVEDFKFLFYVNFFRLARRIDFFPTSMTRKCAISRSVFFLVETLSFSVEQIGKEKLLSKKVNWNMKN